MRRRKLTIAAFLLVAALCLGVGYATVTDFMDITGSADITASQSFDGNVYFSSAVANQDGNTASIATTNSDKATFTAKNLANVGDAATFTFTIESTYDKDVYVKITTIKGTNDHADTYFTITDDWNSEIKTIPAATYTDGNLTQAQTTTVTITVSLKDAPTSAISGSFLVELQAADAQSDLQ